MKPATPVLRFEALMLALALIACNISPAAAQEKDQEKPPQLLPGAKATAERSIPPEPPPEPTASPVPDAFRDSGRSAPVENLPGSPYSASEGRVNQADLTNQPRLRVGEIFENIPGLIVTQHSGFLKAYQYFIRGFSLDHGTDFAVWIDDIPWNLPTHAHGQGYLDLSPLIPEIIEYYDFKKGPYYAAVGDLSSTGFEMVHIADRLPEGIARIESGRYGWTRGLVANCGDFGRGG